jgi:hypothetical protein
MSKEKELLVAIKAGDLNVVEKLIKEGANIHHTDDDEGSYGFTWPLLHHCIFKASSYLKKEYTEIAARLLEHGADIEAVNFTQETPALFAIKYFAPDIFDLLIQKGANIHAVNKQGYNAYDIILDRYYYDQQLDLDHIGDEDDKATKAAIRKGEGPSLTYMFARIDAIVKNGYDLQAGKYSAALCALLEIERTEFPAKGLYYLFDKGADPREYVVVDEVTVPIFELACFKKLPVDVLGEMAVRIGLNHIFDQYEDFDPFVIAIMNGNLKLVKKLVELGADIHAQDELPVVQACIVGNLKIVQYLVELGADIHYVDKKGKKAIDYAEESGFPKIVAYLKTK